jgi:UDP-GlcNAc:undecaprenyl-phosphate/decaprenyl-phosphate GlcNAc-1-phosphate transferase
LFYDTLVLKLIVSFFASFVLIKLLIRFAPKLGLIDVPNHRSIHTTLTPRGAGIGIIAGALLSDLIFLNPFLAEYTSTFIAIVIVFIVGVLDDHRDTAPKTKFIVIGVAVLLMALDGITIHSLGRFFGYEIELGWMAVPFTMFAVAGFTNALNLTDGLDGLAGSISIIILTTLALIGYENHDPFIFTTALTFIVSIAAFMWFNWNPAKIFMGDSGSLTIGFVIALLSIKALDYIQPSTILLIAAIPILDTLIVMIRRKRSGKSIFSPDKLHLHHILLKFFRGNVKKTVIFIALLQILYSSIGMDLSEYERQRYILLFFTINTIILYMLLGSMIGKQNLFSQRRKKK